MYPSSAPRSEFDLQRYAALLDLADVVSRRHEPATLFRDLVPRLRAVSAFDLLHFALYTPTGKTVTLYVWSEGEWPVVGKELSVEQAVPAGLWRDNRAIVIEDLETGEALDTGLQWLLPYDLRSYCGLPLTTENQRLGVLGFGAKSRHAFRPQDIASLNRITEIVALGVDNAQSRDAALILAAESGRAHRALQMLQEIDVSLASNLNLSQQLFAISQCIQKVIPHDHAGVGFCEPDGKSLRLVALDPWLNQLLDGEREPIELQERVLTQAFMDRSTTILKHTELAAIHTPIVDRALEIGIRSICCAPMITANGPMGVLGLASRAEDAFTRADLDLLKNISSTVALWMENALNQETAQKEKVRLQVLLEIDAALSRSQSEFRQVFPAISESIEKVVRHDLAVISVMDWGTGTVRPYTWSGRMAEQFPADGAFLAIDETIRQILRQRESRILTRDELETYASRLSALRQLLESGVKSACFVPLITSAGTIGRLFLARCGEPHFVDDDVQFLKRLAPEMGFALENTLALRALLQEKNRLQALREIDSVLVSDLELEKLLPTVSICLGKIIPHDDFAVFLYDATGHALRTFSASSEMIKSVIPADGVLSLENTLTGQTGKYADRSDIRRARSSHI